MRDRVDLFGELFGAGIDYRGVGAPPWSMDPGTGEAYSLGIARLGVRALFRRSSVARPFIEVGIASRRIESTTPTGENLTTSGGGLTYGVGIHIRPSLESLLIALDLVRTEGRFSNFAVNGVPVSGDAIPTSTGRLSIGGLWFP